VTPKTSDDDWVSDFTRWKRGQQDNVVELNAMAPVAMDNQAGVAELLARITAAPLPVFEEHVYELASELAATINEAPGGPTLGVLVRAHDKLERLVHLTGKDGIANNESIRDSWMDLAGYALIGLLLQDGAFPK